VAQPVAQPVAPRAVPTAVAPAAAAVRPKALAEATIQGRSPKE
jgi:hypothetical protein